MTSRILFYWMGCVLLGNGQICGVVMKDRRLQNLILPSERQNSLSITPQPADSKIIHPKILWCQSAPNLSVPVPPKYEFTPRNNPPENFVAPVPAKLKTVCPSPSIAKQSPPKNIVVQFPQNMSLLLETIRPKIL